MEIRRLRYFLAVADLGHISKAAQQMGMKQPPLSQQVRALEEELGLALFVRHAKGVTLTDAGRELQSQARQLVERMDLLQERMAHYAAGRRGLLAVGFTSSAAAHAFTPSVMRACRREHPDIDLQISENNAAELIEALSAHRIHFGFLRVPVARPPGLVFETLLTEASVLALPLDHPLARRFKPSQAVPLEALRDTQLILVRRPGAPGLYANLLARLQQARIPVRVVAEVERMMANINLVASGTGISIVPASMRGTHAHSVVYRSLASDAGVEAPITLARRETSDGAICDRFLALVRRTAQQMSQEPTAAGRAKARTR
jgi:DNA-binding transcriptional LysR family regulator